MSSLAHSQPWLALGISRATWFRRQKEKGAPDRQLRQTAPSASRAPVIDAALPRNAIMSASEPEIATLRAKLAAIGSDAVITKTGGRLDVASREAFEARQKAAAPKTRRALPQAASAARKLA